MGKLRVYELAKELSMESREVIRRLGKMGLELKNHMSTVDDKFADNLREMVKPNSQKAEYPFKSSGSSTRKPEQRADNNFVKRPEPGQDQGRPAQTSVETKRPQQFDPRNNIQNRTDQFRNNQQNRTSSFNNQGNQNNTGTGNNFNPNKTVNTNNQGQPSRSNYPNNQGQPSRPNYPNNQGQPSRPNYTNNQGQPSRPNYTNNQGQPSRPNYPNNQGQPSRPNYPNNQGQPSRPNYPNNQGQPSRPNYTNSPNKPDAYKGNQTNTTSPNVTNSGNKFPAPKPEQKTDRKPASAYTKAIPPKNKEQDYTSENKNKNNKFSAGQKDNFRPGSKKKPQGKNFKKNFHQKAEIQPTIPKKVIIGETVTVQELAKSMGKTASELIRKLMDMGILATINQEIDSDTAVLIGEEVGIPVEIRLDKTMEIMEDQEEEDDDELLVERPPVVTVMGHVDHGKTSLLDAIRKAHVTATEAGGITQHIGAYQVDVGSKRITFLDTPGHEAFTAMRARGAQVTDISIIVVAADDGVMPQTIEAINHSKAAKVPIIVAINKMDKPNANPDKVKQELTEYGLVSEEWGGETIMAPVSAKTHEGIPQLLEMILLVAEMAELKVNPERVVRGTVIEAELDKGRGPVATVLVQKGTLKVGENIVAGTTFGKVRAMIDDKGRRVKSAGPSMPVVVLGFSDVPPVGEPFVGVQEEKDARYIASKYQIKKREEDLNKTARVSLDDLFKQIAEGIVKDLNVIIKADVQGSIEALNSSLKNLSTSEVRVNTIHGGVGAITESDVMLAATSNAIIIGFNVRPDANIRKMAENEKVDIKLYRVIYEAIDDVKAAMTGLLDPTFKEVVIGHAEVRTTFKVPKAGIIAGCYITDGKITRQADVRVVRDSIVVHEGHIDSLKRFKDDVKEVSTGYECGIGLENYNDLKDGDIIEGYIMEEIKRAL